MSRACLAVLGLDDVVAAETGLPQSADDDHPHRLAVVGDQDLHGWSPHVPRVPHRARRGPRRPAAERTVSSTTWPRTAARTVTPSAVPSVVTDPVRHLRSRAATAGTSAAAATSRCRRRCCRARRRRRGGRPGRGRAVRSIRLASTRATTDARADLHDGVAVVDLVVDRQARGDDRARGEAVRPRPVPPPRRRPSREPRSAGPRGPPEPPRTRRWSLTRAPPVCRKTTALAQLRSAGRRRRG